jgi:hypothetical protein
MEQVESELASLNGADRTEFLSALGVTDEDCGLKVRFYCSLYGRASLVVG